MALNRVARPFYMPTEDQVSSTLQAASALSDAFWTTSSASADGSTSKKSDAPCPTDMSRMYEWIQQNGAGRRLPRCFSGGPCECKADLLSVCFRDRVASTTASLPRLAADAQDGTGWG